MVSNLHQNDKINQLISDYKQNMKAFYITIEKFIRDDESLKCYFTKVISSRSKVTSLDQIEADKTIQRKYSSELKNLLDFIMRLFVRKIVSYMYERGGRVDLGSRCVS
ncbi:hypothetical protein SPAR41_0698 [Streptococcus pneumoniae GA16833]|nr:hypothetical protein SPAR41_0698 [Streptococcus pneumoniae GA16833]